MLTLVVHKFLNPQKVMHNPLFIFRRFLLLDMSKTHRTRVRSKPSSIFDYYFYALSNIQTIIEKLPSSLLSSFLYAVSKITGTWQIQHLYSVPQYRRRAPYLRTLAIQQETRVFCPKISRYPDLLKRHPKFYVLKQFLDFSKV